RKKLTWVPSPTASDHASGSAKVAANTISIPPSTWAMTSRRFKRPPVGRESAEVPALGQRLDEAHLAQHVERVVEAAIAVDRGAQLADAAPAVDQREQRAQPPRDRRVGAPCLVAADPGLDEDQL